MLLRVYKCKNCGADIDMQKARDGAVVCEYCRTKFSVLEYETPEAAERREQENKRLKATVKELRAREEAEQARRAREDAEKARKAREDAVSVGARKAYEIGQKVVFGRYRQSADVEPIYWTILERDGDTALILADKILAARRFNEFGRSKQVGDRKICGNNYAESEIRRWLNTEFYDEAFNAEEKRRILTVTVDNSAQSAADGGEYSCEDTRDKVFLLSAKEVKTLLKTPKERLRAPTLYAKSQGAVQCGEHKTVDGEVSGLWWLRSPNKFRDDYAQHVLNNGDLTFFQVGSECRGIVPAMWIEVPKK